MFYPKPIFWYKNSSLRECLNTKFWLSSSELKLVECLLLFWGHRHLLCWSLQLSGMHQGSEASVLDHICEQRGPELASVSSDTGLVMPTCLPQWDMPTAVLAKQEESVQCKFSLIPRGQWEIDCKGMASAPESLKKSVTPNTCWYPWSHKVGKLQRVFMFWTSVLCSLDICWWDKERGIFNLKECISHPQSGRKSPRRIPNWSNDRCV